MSRMKKDFTGIIQDLAPNRPNLLLDDGPLDPAPVEANELRAAPAQANPSGLSNAASEPTHVSTNARISSFVKAEAREKLDAYCYYFRLNIKRGLEDALDLLLQSRGANIEQEALKLYRESRANMHQSR